MTEPSILTYHYLETQPVGAARVFEQLEAADVAAFLNEAPARLTAPAVAAMTPWSAAQCLVAAEAESAAAVLRQMSHQDATSVLRLIEAGRRQEILAGLSERQARRFDRALKFPRNTVGAWMDHGAPSLPAASRVAQALELASRTRGVVGSHIFVIDDERKLAGAVLVGDLLRRDKSALLEQIMETGVPRISNRAALGSVVGSAAWDRFTALPVVGRKANLLGVLTRENLRRGMADQSTQAAPASMTGSLASELFNALLISGNGLLQLFSSQSDREVHRDRRR